MQKKIEGKIFEERFVINNGCDIYDHCVFLDEVVIDGPASPTFLKCTFCYEGVSIQNGGKGLFVERDEKEEEFFKVRIDGKDSFGDFRDILIEGLDEVSLDISNGGSGNFSNCRLSSDGVNDPICAYIDEGSSANFSKCAFCCIPNDGVIIGKESFATFDHCLFSNFYTIDEFHPVGPVTLFDNIVEKTIFTKCRFFGSDEQGRYTFCIGGKGDANFHSCNFFFPKGAIILDKPHESKSVYKNCRFNTEFPLSKNQVDCSYEPNAKEDDFLIV